MSAIESLVRTRNGNSYPSQAQPLPLWQVFSLEMQLSPQALPLLQTLQQRSLAIAALPTNPHDENVDGPIASVAAAIIAVM